MYIDAILSKETDTVKVVERINGKRVLRDIPIDYTFYHLDPNGKFVSIYDEKLSRTTPRSNEEFVRMKNAFSHKKLYESDVNLIFRCLEQNYKGLEPPTPNIAFFDIETAFDPDLGYAPPEEAFNPIISISVHLQWLNQMVCLAVPPPTLSWEQASDIANNVGNTILFRNEREMLDTFLDLIEDADILSGWNSESYDIPYIVNRIAKTMGKHDCRRLCLWNQLPKKKTVEKKGNQVVIFDLYGRIHLDYLILYKKYAYEEKQSYTLDSIAEAELNDRKVPYDGTLDQLYKRDFDKFLKYNIQDSDLLNRLDKKLQYIDLANQIAHDNCVLLPTAMGTVSMVEQAITMEAHGNGKIVPNRKSNDSDYDDRVIFTADDDEDEDEDDKRAAGGWVSKPKVGLHKWVANSDINSLYPSVIRALNMSPETLIGQIRTDETEKTLIEFINAAPRNSFAQWWNDRFTTLEMDRYMNNDNCDMLTLDLENGDVVKLTGAELRDLIFNGGQNWNISANGTIFRQDKMGVIPSLLGRWYSERKQLQKKEKEFGMINVGLKIPDEMNILIDQNKATKDYTFAEIRNLELSLLYKAISDGDSSKVKEMMEEWGMEIRSNSIFPKKDLETLYKQSEEYWYKRQLVKKISLNSAYGGLLNAHMKFFDQRIGQSTTLTGRCITRHMAAKTNEMLCGEYDHYGKCIIYGDSVTGDTVIRTSSGDFSIEELFENNLEHLQMVGDREYVYPECLFTIGYHNMGDKIIPSEIDYVYRHKVDKDIYEIELSNGKKVKVTEDHSIMVIRNDELVEVKPTELLEDDEIYCLNGK